MDTVSQSNFITFVFVSLPVEAPSHAACRPLLRDLWFANEERTLSATLAASALSTLSWQSVKVYRRGWHWAQMTTPVKPLPLPSSKTRLNRSTLTLCLCDAGLPNSVQSKLFQQILCSIWKEQCQIFNDGKSIMLLHTVWKMTEKTTNFIIWKFWSKGFITALKIILVYGGCSFSVTERDGLHASVSYRRSPLDRSNYKTAWA